MEDPDMNRVLRVGCLLVVAILSLTNVCAAAELLMRPGPRAELRDKGYDEPAFVAPRSAGAPIAKAQSANIEVTYIDFTAEAQAAFQAAVDIWSTLMSSPVTIRVEATWSSDLDEETLGRAGSNFVWANFSGAPELFVFYTDALADSLSGEDQNPGEPDIMAEFNSEFSDWYFGIDGNTPSGTIDFVTVVLHELCHGLGFSASATVDDEGQGSWGYDTEVGVLAEVFDTFMEDGAGTAILDESAFPNPSADLAEVLQSGDLFWNGPRAVAVAGGRPRMFAPSTWAEGSSYSHLNESTYPAGHPDSLMTPSIGRAEAIHDPGQIALAMLEDTGWVTEASFSYWVATAAQVSGENDSQWRTSLGLYNRSAAPATIELVYRRSGGPTVTRALSLLAGHQRVIDDVVAFVGSTRAGSLEVVSDQPLIVGSRTYNDSDSGTFGQYIDGVRSADGVAAGQSVFLTMLEQSPDFRSNIGFTNTGAENARVSVVLYDDEGVEVTRFSVTVAPGANRQDNQPYSERGGRNDIRGGTAAVTVETGSGVLVYGSLIDQITGDATTIPPKR
jgi:hypothetical protein